MKPVSARWVLLSPKAHHKTFFPCIQRTPGFGPSNELPSAYVKVAPTWPVTTVNNSQRVLKSLCSFLLFLFLFIIDTNYSEQRWELFNI